MADSVAPHVHASPAGPNRREFLHGAGVAALAALAVPTVGATCAPLDTSPYHGRKGSNDEDFMAIAIELAKKDPLAPFGAVIVYQPTMTVVGVGVNEILTSPIDHGEIMAIDDLMKNAGPIEHIEAGFGLLHRYNLYTTAESCPMCMSAIVWAGFGQMIYGTSMPYLIEHTIYPQIKVRASEIAAAAPYKVVARGGVLEAETNKLFGGK